MSRKNWSTEKLFFRLLNNTTKATYWDTIHEVCDRPTSEVFERAITLGNSEVERERIIGIDVLAQLRPDTKVNQKHIKKLLFSLLNIEQRPKIIIAALFAIEHYNDSLNKKEVLTILHFKNHDCSDIRLGVVVALSGIENDMVIQSLIELSRDSHRKVRDWATFAIGSQIEMNSTSILHALKERLTDSDHDTRFEAISGLAQRKDISVRKTLLDELETINSHGSLILESIVLLGDMSFVPILQAKIEANKVSKTINEKWLIDCLEELQNIKSIQKK